MPPTPKTLLTLVHDGAEPRRWRTWLRHVVADWPRGRTPPGTRVFELDRILLRAGFTLGEIPERRHEVREPHPAEVVVLVRGPGMATGDLYKVVDAMQRELCPLIVLDDAPGRDAPDVRGEGILVEPAHAPEVELARVIQVLLDRQPLVRRLGSEIRVAQQAQHGMSGEIERIGEELQLAARVQRQLVPQRMPELPGLRIASVYRPAGYVSGDIFDVRVLSAGRLAFFLADTVGHGVPAALLTVSIARAMAAPDMGERSPGEALRVLNAELCEQLLGSGRFATAVYGILDVESGRLRVSSAGHPAPILAAPGENRRVEGGGPLLGVMPGAEFDEASLVLREGEALVLFSDGLETAYPDRDAEEHRLHLPTPRHLEYLATFGARCARAEAGDQAVREFEAELEGRAGSLHQPDDITVLVIARPGAEPGRAGEDPAAALARAS